MPNLLDQVKADQRAIFSSGGFTCLVSVISPDQKRLDEIPVIGGDITRFQDLGTGDVVAGRYINISFSLLPLMAASMGTPQGVADATEKPWLVEKDGVTLKVHRAHPDFTLGIVSLELAGYGE